MADYKVLEINVDDLGFGGVYSLVKNVIKNSPSYLQLDIACVEHFVKQENIDYVNSFGSQVHYIGYEGNKFIKQIACVTNLCRLIKKEHYDCVHVHADVANKLLVSGLAAKISGVKKIILHSHAAGVDGNHRKIKKLFHNSCKYFLKYIGSDFASCSDLAAHWMFPNIAQDKIQMINNGVNLSKFRFNADMRIQMRKELGISDEFLIGHIGRFAYQKNHDYLIDLFAATLEIIPNAKLLLIGQGPLESDIRKKVADKGLQEQVIFYGTSFDVQNLFQAMDVFVLPSHFEGLPIVGVEAQAAGLPVLFSDEITKEAQLIATVSFLPITEAALPQWRERLREVSHYSRQDTYQELKDRGFCIEDTVSQFLEFYH